MAAVTFNKPWHPPQLKTELAAAGIPTNGFWSVGETSGTIGTYDAQGGKVDLPPAAQAVVDAHVSQVATEDTAQRTALDDLIANIDQTITAVEANGWDGLTAAQRKTVMLRVLKAIRALAKRAR